MTSIESRELTPSQRAAGQRAMMRANLFSSLIAQIVDGFLMMLYANDVLGFSPKKIAAILAVVPLMSVARLFLLDRIRSMGKIRSVLVGNVFRFLAMVAILAIPARHLSFPLYLGLVMTYALSREIGVMSVWQSVLHDITTRADRGRFFARMRFLLQGVSATLAMSITFLIGQSITEWQYKGLIALGLFGLGFQSYWFSRIPELRQAPPDGAGENVGENARPLWKRLWTTLRTSPLLRRPLLIALLSVFCALPVGVIYMKQMLHIPTNFVSLIVFAMTLSSVLSFLVWGQIADTLGFRPMMIGILLISMLMLPLHLLAAPFPERLDGAMQLPQIVTLAVLVVQGIIGGALAAGTGIAMSSIEHYHVRSEDSLEALNLHAAVVMLTTSLFTVFAGYYLQDIALPRGVTAFANHTLHIDWVRGYAMVAGFLLQGIIISQLVKLPNTRPHFDVGDFFAALGAHSIRATFTQRHVRHEDEARRLQVARWFGEHAGPMAIDPLLDLMNDPSYDVKTMAIRGLANTRSPLAGRRLLDMLQDDTKRAVADHVAWALGELEYHPALDALIERLDVKYPDRIRAMAARTLGKLGDVKAIEALAALLTPEHLAQHQHVTASACRALLRLEDAGHIGRVCDVLAALTQREERYELMDVLCGFLGISNAWVLSLASGQPFRDGLLDFVAPKPAAWRQARQSVLEAIGNRDLAGLKVQVGRAASEPSAVKNGVVQSLNQALGKTTEWQPIAVLASAWLLFREE